MGYKALLNTITNKIFTLPILILYVTEGCNLKCVMCSYRDRLPDELSLKEIEELASELANSGLKRIVYSGGEPLLRTDLEQICGFFAEHKVKQTLLTNGLLVKKKIGNIARFLDELIVSIDGAVPEIHDEIRGVNSLNLIIDGVKFTREKFPDLKISFRTVIQKSNFMQIKDIIRLGADLGISRVSFLPVDVYSEAFGRENKNDTGIESALLLSRYDIDNLRKSIIDIGTEFQKYFLNHFISESFDKLMGYADYFEAGLTGSNFPRVYCNAPMMSTVITARGDVLPCFFLPKLGNIRERPLNEILNSEEAVSTRKNVRAFTLKRCQTCVCSLNVAKFTALKENF